MKGTSAHVALELTHVEPVDQRSGTRKADGVWHFWERAGQRHDALKRVAQTPECRLLFLVGVKHVAFGATRARLLAENLGEFAPKDVVAPRSDGVPRTAKYQAALEGGHDVLVLISEVWGGFSPEAMRFLGELAQARNDGIDIERASTTWSTSSFTSYHGQLLSLAVQWGVAIEIERAIKKNASF